MKRLEAPRSMEAQSYCFNKGYKIYPIPEGLDYRIQIEYKGQTKLGEKTYSKTEWYDAIWELYDRIYGLLNRLLHTLHNRQFISIAYLHVLARYSARAGLLV